jgi:predicted RNA-binding protein with PUA-like domain
VVEIEPVRALDRPVSLEEMRKNPKLAGLDLLRLPRLSFLPVSRSHWEAILRMSGSRR